MLEIGLSRLRMCRIRSLQDFLVFTYYWYRYKTVYPISWQVTWRKFWSCPQLVFVGGWGAPAIWCCCRRDCSCLVDRTISIKLGQTRSKRPIGSKKTDFSIRSPISIISEKLRAVIFATRPLGKRKTPPDRSWREIGHILRRERTIFNISGANAHANVLKGTFSTEGESDCIRIGLRWQVVAIY